ncbi:MAG TPA: hypothetical protein VNK04_07850 [Gemmataceae bacterium]|jgi:hypothetical protein|nr:hypothetical protein [Gemmataceae bacterium]
MPVPVVDVPTPGDGVVICVGCTDVPDRPGMPDVGEEKLLSSGRPVMVPIVRGDPAELPRDEGPIVPEVVVIDEPPVMPGDIVEPPTVLKPPIEPDVLLN